MSLQSAIADYFNITTYNTDEDRFIPVKCVIHRGNKKNAGLNFSTNVFNCFGCNKSFSFKKLANMLGLDVSEEEDENAMEVLDRYFPSKRNNNHPPKIKVKEFVEFLKSKKIKLETIEKWDGYFVDDKEDKLFGYLKFPLEADAYCARKILPNARGLGDGQRFYNKGTRTLLGKSNIKLFETLILTEGITDFLTMCQLGYENVVCSMGAKLSEAQAYLLRGKTVFIIYDKDFAGYSGALAAQILLKQYKANGVIIELPDIDGDKVDINRMYVEDKPSLVRFLKDSIKRFEKFDKDYVVKLHQRATPMKYFATGIPALDECFNGGFTVGCYGISGETGIGKSTIVTSMIPRFVEQGAKVMLCSYELNKVQCWARLAAPVSSWSFADLERDFSLLERDVLDGYVLPLSNNLKIELMPTLPMIEASIKDVDVVIIDYLQRMNLPIGVTDTNQAVAKNNAELSRLMMEYGKTIIFVSSMSNAGSLFKGSGDVQYTAQGALLLKKLSNKRMSMEITKNTRGKEGQIIFLDINYPHQTVVQSELMGEDSV